MVRVLNQASAWRAGRPQQTSSVRQYDETIWLARSWLSFQSQKLSVALHLALTWELGAELARVLGCAARPTDRDPRGPPAA
eukprot:2508397-Prymnesium_polylepis.1